MSTPDLRPPRQERKKIIIRQPTQGEKGKIQFRSMGTVELSEIDPKLVDAIREKKKAMDQKIESQASGKKGTPYLLFRQISTDFMPRRSHGALTHRRNNHRMTHTEGFEYIPDDETMDTPAAEAGSSGTTRDEMVIDTVESTQREIETPGTDDDIYNATPPGSPRRSVREASPVDDISNATPPGSSCPSLGETSPADKAAQAEAAQVKAEDREPQLTTETQTAPAQPTETAEPCVKIE
ncbi:hypothetical protein V8F33_003512 [Rhypophila sp. PSN 637]